MHRVPIVGSIKYNSSLLEGSNSIASTKTEDVRYPEEKEASSLKYFFEHYYQQKVHLILTFLLLFSSQTPSFFIFFKINHCYWLV